MKPFFRESNIWRLIGLTVLIASGILGFFAPESKPAFSNEHFSLTVPGIIAILGFVLAGYPTLREPISAWIGERNQQARQRRNQPPFPVESLESKPQAETPQDPSQGMKL